MKSKLQAVFAAMIVAALCAFSPAPASAQDATSVYTVAGVRVDETAANAAAAQSQGLTSAARIGFERLARRLTPVIEQDRLATLQLDPVALERLALSVDVEEERRSATRYIARLTVRFDPTNTRATLRGAGFTVIDSRAPPMIVVPVLGAGGTPEQLAAWQGAWADSGAQHELAPLIATPIAADFAPDWTMLAPLARQHAASSALVAALRLSGQSVTASVTELNADGQRRDRGEVNARVTGLDAAALRAAMDQLTQQISAVVQADWKARAVVAQGPRSRVSASALYADQRQWERIKAALEAAAQTTISEIRIEAVGRDGALVSFSFTGDRAALGEELNRQGLSLEEGSMGPVLRIAGGR